ncbi:MAG TPA: hypothetical protein VIM64_17655 [Puia sp.]
MNTIKIKKLKVDQRMLDNLPIFYDFIVCNGLVNIDEFSTPVYSEKYTSYVPEARPNKLISKIIDFSPLKSVKEWTLQ